jgi:peptidyl-prolyl cis-trans isomerase SurA
MLAADQVVDKVVAQVNGELITLFELNDKTKTYVTQVAKRPYNEDDPAIQQLRDQILQSMIEDILLRQEGARLKINITDVEVETRIRGIREKANLSEAQFEQQLRLEGMTHKQFAENLKKDILKKELLDYMVQRKVLVSDDEVKQYYQEHPDEFTATKGGAGQRIGLIMTAKVEEAKALRTRIASGQISFADAARKFSIGPGAQQGGDLGKVSWKDLAPELQKALEGLPAGGVSQPVLLDGKPVLLTLSGTEDKAKGVTPAFDSVKEEVYERVYRAKLEKLFREYMDKLRAKSVIKVNL